jgi:hypothetical protein
VSDEVKRDEPIALGVAPEEAETQESALRADPVPSTLYPINEKQVDGDPGTHAENAFAQDAARDASRLTSGEPANVAPTTLTRAEKELRRHPMKVIRGKGMMIEVPWVKLARVVPEEERCKYEWFGDREITRCEQSRMEDKEMCPVHNYWEMTCGGASELPAPVDPASMHLFMMSMMGYVMQGMMNRQDRQQMISMAKMMMRTVREFEEKRS